MMNRNNQRQGFTLIELSIALVIIGLIIGGILVGRDLIRTAELRSVIKDIDSIRTAILTFQSKYNCLPGDCANATSIFGATDSNGIAVVNGDGNGRIGGFPSAANREMFQAYSQLSAANLVAGRYSGDNAGASARNAKPGVNIMASVINNAGYTIDYWASYTDGNDFSPSVTNHYSTHSIFFGKSSSYESYEPAVTPSDAFFIDGKMDDGLPASGLIVVQAPVAFSTCTTTANSATARYNLSTTTIACGLNFFLKL